VRNACYFEKIGGAGRTG